MHARLKQIAKALAISFGPRAREPQLRVLLFHHIPEARLAEFETLIETLSRSFQFVSTPEFERARLGTHSLARNALLISFDDGFDSQFRATRRVLDPRGIKGLFFIPSGFISCRDARAAQEYVARNLCAGRIAPEQVAGDLAPMTWDQLRILSHEGHTIGSHTVNHLRLSTLTVSELEQELGASKAALHAELALPIEHFAYPFGDRLSLGETALSCALQHYACVHTGLRGNNVGAGGSPALVWRESLTADAGAKFGTAACLGAFDYWYARDRRTLRASPNFSRSSLRSP